MFCHNCGNAVDDDAEFCANCGACIICSQNKASSETQSVSNTTPTQQPVANSEMDSLAVTGFILAFFMPIVGLILCRLALGKTVKYPALAKAGLIISIVEITVAAVAIIISVATTISAINRMYDYLNY